MVGFSHVTTGQFLFDIKVGSHDVRNLKFSSNGENLAVVLNNKGITLLRVQRKSTGIRSHEQDAPKTGDNKANSPLTPKQ